MWWIAGWTFLAVGIWRQHIGNDGENQFMLAVFCAAVASIIKAIEERE